MRLRYEQRLMKWLLQNNMPDLIRFRMELYFMVSPFVPTQFIIDWIVLITHLEMTWKLTL